DFYANGTFTLTTSLYLSAGGIGNWATLTVNNAGFHASSYLYALGQWVYVAGDLHSDGTFSVQGSIYVNAAGIGGWGTFTADNAGLHTSAWVVVLGQYSYIHGDIYANGWFNLYGGVWINVAGIGVEADFRADPNGVHVNTY